MILCYENVLDIFFFFLITWLCFSPSCSFPFFWFPEKKIVILLLMEFWSSDLRKIFSLWKIRPRISSRQTAWKFLQNFPNYAVKTKATHLRLYHTFYTDWQYFTKPILLLTTLNQINSTLKIIQFLFLKIWFWKSQRFN